MAPGFQPWGLQPWFWLWHQQKKKAGDAINHEEEDYHCRVEAKESMVVVVPFSVVEWYDGVLWRQVSRSWRIEEKTKTKKGNLPFIVWGDKRRRDPFRGQPSLWFNWCANDTTFLQDLFLKYYAIKHDYIQTREGNSFITNVNHSRRGQPSLTWNESISENMGC